MLTIKTALVSVWNKQGVADFARELSELGIQIMSTGGTARLLKEKNMPVREVARYTGAEEMLGGRVKTLHPKIHAGLLALRDNPEQMEQIRKQGIVPIDMVVVNLYPFGEVIKDEQASFAEILENIDIGGPTMLRSGAKNFGSVAVVSSPEQYSCVLEELKQNKGELSEETSYQLAVQAFQTTSFYDSVVANYLRGRKKIKFPSFLNLSLKKVSDLRYGENPHQQAAFYQEPDAPNSSLPRAEKISGKDISFNNLLDFEAALNITGETKNPFCVVIKHSNPCGAAEGDSLHDVCPRAFEGDPVSAFGSIVGLSRPLDAQTAEYIADPKKFVEGILAPDYEKEALRILKQKTSWGKKLIILKVVPQKESQVMDMRKITGGLLVQDEDTQALNKDAAKSVTERDPTRKEFEDLEFAWKICKHVKSNAILLAKDKMVVGVGAGQMSRIDAALIAIRKAGDRCRGAVMASDAFFPFPDVVQEAHEAGIKAIIQPGGSVRDRQVIDAANRYQMAMVFTGVRHFLH